MDMISVIIPVFRESKLLEVLLNQLKEDDYENKEIITVIDEPTKNSLKTIEKNKGKVRFIINKKRLGKVKALNRATKIAKGDIFLFIDSDTIISKRSKNFLKKVAEKMENADILDIRKNSFRDSLISKLTTYEYLGSTLYGHFLSKIKRCVAVCGQAFAIKRSFFENIGGFKNVVSEDLEIGTQTLIQNKKYDFANNIEVLNKSSENWKKWFAQRKRWGLGTGYHMKNHWRLFVKTARKHPKILLPLFFFGWPTIFSALILLFINSFFDKVLILLLFSLSLKFTFLTPAVLIAGLYMVFLKNIFVFFITYLFSAIAFYISARKFNYKYNNLEFAMYYLFYSPLFSCVFLYYFLKAVLSSESIKLQDWKV
jgi:cellulose synthase/poly-beta-1,6-N-acetylglucosamine synthase-like glycosyltransferase